MLRRIRPFFYAESGMKRGRFVRELHEIRIKIWKFENFAYLCNRIPVKMRK